MPVEAGAARRMKQGEVVLLLQILPQRLLQQAAFQDEGQFRRAQLIGGKVQFRTPSSPNTRICSTFCTRLMSSRCQAPHSSEEVLRCRG